MPAPPDPGGYLEESNFGGPAHWHSYNGKDLYGPAAIDQFNKFASSPKPGGTDDATDPHDENPQFGDPHGDPDVPDDPNEDPDDEDEYGPDGSKMPRVKDLPQYTVWGQILKRADK